MTAVAERPGPRQQRRAQLRAVVRELERRQTPAELHAKQRLAYETPATEVLYGGAAGGGKSYVFRRAAINWCKLIPGLQVYIFRREFADLFKNHMEGTGSFPELLREQSLSGQVKIVWSKNQIRFRNGSVIHLCHCQHEKDVYGYQGAEIHVLMIDELTQWSWKMYLYLRGRVRLGGLQVPAWLADRFPRILCGANPGGIGHNAVKAAFIDNAPPLEIVRMPKKEGGMLRQFIPAKLEDNPTLTDNDPDYEHRLEGLGDPALVRAMREGDWDIVSGGMFDDLWRRDVHVLKPFEIPSSWRVDRSFDWGSSKPFSVGWWAESDGTVATMPDGTKRHFPRGTLFRIGEWYGWDGKNPDVGTKMTAADVGRGIVKRETAAGIRARVKPGPADSQIWVSEPGVESTGDTLKKNGAAFVEADKRPGSRKVGWEAMRRLLEASAATPMEEAGLFVFDTCTQFIRTVPTLPRSDRDTDDVETKAEDHIADEARYRIMAPNRTSRTFKYRV